MAAVNDGGHKQDSTMHDGTPPEADARDDAPQLTALGEAKAEVEGLVRDVRAYVEAERALWTGRAAFTGKTVKSISILGIIAAGLTIGALNVLALGGLLILAAYFGPIAATLIMLGALILVITICAAIIKSKVKLLKFKNPE